jgi:hypothetical protein
MGAADDPNGRHNIGTVNLDAKELKFAADGSLSCTSRTSRRSKNAQANWLPAPERQFALIVRTFSTAGTSCRRRRRDRDCACIERSAPLVHDPKVALAAPGAPSMQNSAPAMTDRRTRR